MCVFSYIPCTYSSQRETGVLLVGLVYNLLEHFWKDTESSRSRDGS